MVIFQIPGVASYSFVIRQISTNSGVVCAAVRCESFSALAHTYPDIFEKRNLFPSFCTERFSMISLFASNIICSFQIFALTLFIVIHWLNLHKEVLAAQKDSCHFYYPLFHLLCVRQVIIIIIIKKSTVFLNKQNWLLVLFSLIHILRQCWLLKEYTSFLNNGFFDFSLFFVILRPDEIYS